jgi:hypothetical protein
MLFPVYAALAAALLFYLILPVAGAFRLRGQWHRFRDRVVQLALAPPLRYSDIAAARREGRSFAGPFRLYGTIEAIEGSDQVWVKGPSVSALVDLSHAPLYVASPGPSEAGSISRLRWGSVSSLVEGTTIFVGGLLSIKDGRPIFVDSSDEMLVAVCHDEEEGKLLPRLVSGGRAPNEYWNYMTVISLSLGVATISGILLAYGSSSLPSLRTLVFLAGALPILPFAPPGLALFFAYRRFWRLGIASRTSRDLLRMPLRCCSFRQTMAINEEPPKSATWLAIPIQEGPRKSGYAPPTLFATADPVDPSAQSFVVDGDPETRARKVEWASALYVAASGLSFGLSIALNFALAFALWRLFAS